MLKNKHSGIDLVVTWVDGSDANWQKKRDFWLAKEGEKPERTGQTDTRAERYRDFDTLRYFFRGVEENAPWVRYVHFVTEGHLPSWLNTEHPKLRIIRHEDFMPKDALPTFNSNALELNFHCIQGLSERFVYCNDDMFFVRKTTSRDFFRKKKPVDMLALQPVVANPKNPVMSNILLNDTVVISRHFDKRSVMKKHADKFFHIGYPPMYFIYNLLETAFPLYTGFYTVHGPAPLMKSTYKELWEKEGAVLSETTARKFRSAGDVTQYLFREWEKQKGNFCPVNLHRKFAYYEVGESEKRLSDILSDRRITNICLNDTSAPVDFLAEQGRVTECLKRHFPKQSLYEKT